MNGQLHLRDCSNRVFHRLVAITYPGWITAATESETDRFQPTDIQDMMRSQTKYIPVEGQHGK